ncbi:hypothetical protein ACHAWF_002654 [Thalassiosira exigua]
MARRRPATKILRLSLSALAFSTPCQALSPLIHLHLHGSVPSPPRDGRPSRLSMVGSGAGASYSEPEERRPGRRRAWSEYAPPPDAEVPTVTQRDPTRLDQAPPRPKVVVFGASGRLGRRVVRRLLESEMDVDVVAFVRSAQKLERVLYDEEDLVVGNLVDAGRGPRLKVVEADVVSQRDVYQREFETEDERRVLDDWVGKSRRYFAGLGWNYNNSTELHSFEDDAKVAADVNALESGGEEALRDAVSGATVLVSCLAAFRPSDVWTDFLRVPVLRVFRRDASQWCSDPSHPYYVHYLSTRKILEEAEAEQRRRDQRVQVEKERAALEERARKARERAGGREEKGFESEIADRLAEMRKKRSAGLHDRRDAKDNNADALQLPGSNLRPSPSDRIKFIRVSHLMLGRSPFRPWAVLTNILWSQISRFELMTEMIMESSTLVDTIVVRPGELTDAVRNRNHTSLQMRIDGRVDSPSLVGREDVSDLVALAALTKTSGSETGLPSKMDATSRQGQPSPAHHYTWAMRWAGQHLSPQQGLRPDGLRSADCCIVRALEEQAEADQRRMSNERKLTSYRGGGSLMRFRRWRRGLRTYAHSFAVAGCLYVAMGLLLYVAMGQIFLDLCTRLKLKSPRLLVV